jgi:hypothetical protein
MQIIYPTEISALVYEYLKESVACPLYLVPYGSGRTVEQFSLRTGIEAGRRCQCMISRHGIHVMSSSPVPMRGVDRSLYPLIKMR